MPSEYDSLLEEPAKKEETSPYDALLASPDQPKQESRLGSFVRGFGIPTSLQELKGVGQFLTRNPIQDLKDIALGISEIPEKLGNLGETISTSPLATVARGPTSPEAFGVYGTAAGMLLPGVFKKFSSLREIAFGEKPTAISPEAVPKTPETPIAETVAQQPIIGGETNAEQVISPTQVHGDVQYAPRPEEGGGQVPTDVGGEGVPTRGQGEIVQGQEAVTLYHSTPKKFEAFTGTGTPTGLGGKAFYFSDKPEPAYGENVVPVTIPKDKILDISQPDIPYKNDAEIRKAGYEGTFNPQTGEYTVYDPNQFISKPEAVEPAVPQPEQPTGVGPVSPPWELSEQDFNKQFKFKKKVDDQGREYGRVTSESGFTRITNATNAADAKVEARQAWIQENSSMQPVQSTETVGYKPLTPDTLSDLLSSKSLPVTESLPPVPEAEAPTTAAPLPKEEVAAAAPEEPIRPTGISNQRLTEAYGDSAPVATTGKGPGAWKDEGFARLGNFQKTGAIENDPYAVLTSLRERNAPASASDVSLLRAEHQRLLEDARKAEGTPLYDEKSQAALDMATAIKGVAHGPASDVFRALQEYDQPRYDNITDFDQALRERIGRESTFEEKAQFKKMANDVTETRNGAEKEINGAQKQLNKYPRMSFEDAYKSIHDQITELTKDCVIK